jgi:hypothetical protein
LKAKLQGVSVDLIVPELDPDFFSSFCANLFINDAIDYSNLKWVKIKQTPTSALNFYFKALI